MEGTVSYTNCCKQITAMHLSIFELSCKMSKLNFFVIILMAIFLASELHSWRYMCAKMHRTAFAISKMFRGLPPDPLFRERSTTKRSNPTSSVPIVLILRNDHWPDADNAVAVC